MLEFRMQNNQESVWNVLWLKFKESKICRKVDIKSEDGLKDELEYYKDGLEKINMEFKIEKYLLI